jgi:hypothetical protein
VVLLKKLATNCSQVDMAFQVSECAVRECAESECVESECAESECAESKCTDLVRRPRSEYSLYVPYFSTIFFLIPGESGRSYHHFQIQKERYQVSPGESVPISLFVPPPHPQFKGFLIQVNTINHIDKSLQKYLRGNTMSRAASHRSSQCAEERVRGGASARSSECEEQRVRGAASAWRSVYEEQRVRGAASEP